MGKALKILEKGVVYGARAGWAVFSKINAISPNKSFTPKWSDKPLLKSYQKEKPPLGWPRTTDSFARSAFRRSGNRSWTGNCPTRSC